MVCGVPSVRLILKKLYAITIEKTLNTLTAIAIGIPATMSIIRIRGELREKYPKIAPRVSIVMIDLSPLHAWITSKVISVRWIIVPSR